METAFEEYFGAVVVVQLKDAVQRVASSGKVQPYMVVSSGGELTLDVQRMAPAAREQIVPAAEKDAFSFIYVGRLFPAKGNRLHLVYEVEGYLARMTVSPDDILSVSWLESKLDSPLVRPASA